jgi:hypothetical protein
MAERQFSDSAPRYLVLYSLNQLTPFKIAVLQMLQLRKKNLNMFSDCESRSDIGGGDVLHVFFI